MAAGHGTPTPLGLRSFLAGQCPLFPWVRLCLDSRLDQLPPAQQEGFQDGRGRMGRTWVPDSHGGAGRGTSHWVGPSLPCNQKPEDPLPLSFESPM